MKTAILNHEYNEFSIPQRESDGYVSLTKMAVAYPLKRLNDFTDNKATNAYLAALSEKTGIPVFRLIEIRQGRNGGTWAHPEVAVKFAAWLDPYFEVWAMRQLVGIIAAGTPNPMGLKFSIKSEAELVLAKDTADKVRKIYTGMVKSPVRDALIAGIGHTIGIDFLALEELSAPTPVTDERFQALLASIQKKGPSTARELQMRRVLNRFGLTKATEYRELLTALVAAGNLELDGKRYRVQKKTV